MQLQGHLGSCQQELKALQGTHAATKEELAAALERSAALEAKLQAAGAELESLAKQLAELRRAKEEEIAELKRLREAEVSELKRLREADIAAWTEERAALKVRNASPVPCALGMHKPYERAAHITPDFRCMLSSHAPANHECRRPSRQLPSGRQHLLRRSQRSRQRWLLPWQPRSRCALVQACSCLLLTSVL